MALVFYDIRKVFRMYAVVANGGKQYKVAKGDVFDVEKLDVEPGKKVDLDVLLLAGDKGIVTGEALAGAKVSAKVVEHFKDKKVLIFKFKKRKGYKRTQGHRQNLTRLEVTKVSEA
jgi:large subunit ribosomal protein L21